MPGFFARLFRGDSQRRLREYYDTKTMEWQNTLHAMPVLRSGYLKDIAYIEMLLEGCLNNRPEALNQARREESAAFVEETMTMLRDHISRANAARGGSQENAEMAEALTTFLMDYLLENWQCEREKYTLQDAKVLRNGFELSCKRAATKRELDAQSEIVAEWTRKKAELARILEGELSEEMASSYEQEFLAAKKELKKAKEAESAIKIRLGEIDATLERNEVFRRMKEEGALLGWLQQRTGVTDEEITRYAELLGGQRTKIESGVEVTRGVKDTLFGAAEAVEEEDEELKALRKKRTTKQAEVSGLDPEQVSKTQSH